jgi:hypothetical protein
MYKKFNHLYVNQTKTFNNKNLLSTRSLLFKKNYKIYYNNLFGLGKNLFPKKNQPYPKLLTKNGSNNYVGNLNTFIWLIQNPLLFKEIFNESFLYQQSTIINKPKINPIRIHSVITFFLKNFSPKFKIFKKIILSNIKPDKNFRLVFFKKILTSSNLKKIHLNFIPFYYNTLVRFMEYISGKKTLIQFYPFINQSVTNDWIIRYKL